MIIFATFALVAVGCATAPGIDLRQSAVHELLGRPDLPAVVEHAPGWGKAALQRITELEERLELCEASRRR